MFGHKGHQGNKTSPFNGISQSPLVPGTGTGAAAGFNFAAVRYVSGQFSRILVINTANLFSAERTYLALGGIAAAPTPGWSVRSFLDTHSSKLLSRDLIFTKTECLPVLIRRRHCHHHGHPYRCLHWLSQGR
jgi:hypothetical protein